ncbi:MAG: putative beta-lysine N-acetyltransferase [Armatimonadota bacterium]
MALPGQASVQIDMYNQRIKLLTCGEDVTATVAAVTTLARAQSLDKIWGFVSQEEWAILQQLGFVWEGALDGYFIDGPAIAVANYLGGQRALSSWLTEENEIIGPLLAEPFAMQHDLPTDYHIHVATPDESEAVSRVLTTVFSTYPTPITPGAIAESMQGDMLYLLATNDGKVVSVMSADINREHLVAEMTDCATLPEHRGRGIMSHLLAVMECRLRDSGLRTLFTLARAKSVGMNTAFAHLGYTYRGRLINNCHIAGEWEDMNLWVKRLEAAELP